MFNLEHEEEEEVDETSKPKDGMSFTEKIVAWLDRPERQSPEPVDASEKFEGVEDDLDLSSNHAELPLYSQKIFQSKAYKFLIEDLLKESTLQWEGSQLWAADAIRHRIIGGLPPTKISKSRDPCIHDIEFQIPQQGIKRRLQHEMERRTVGIREAMLTAVVLVSSSDDVIQATTVEEYVKQTWGLRDMRLFDIIGGLLAEELSPSNCKRYQGRDRDYGLLANLHRRFGWPCLDIGCSHVDGYHQCQGEGGFTFSSRLWNPNGVDASGFARLRLPPRRGCLHWAFHISSQSPRSLGDHRYR